MSIFHEFLKRSRGGLPINSGSWRALPSEYVCFEAFMYYNPTGINGSEYGFDCGVWIDFLNGGDTHPVPMSLFYGEPFINMSRVFVLIPAGGKQYIIGLSPTALLATQLNLKNKAWDHLPADFATLISIDSYVRNAFEERPLGAARFLPPNENDPDETESDIALTDPRGEIVLSVSKNDLSPLISRIEANQGVRGGGILEVWVIDNDRLNAVYLESSFVRIYKKWQNKQNFGIKHWGKGKFWAHFSRSGQPIRHMIEQSPKAFYQRPIWFNETIEREILHATRTLPPPPKFDQMPFRLPQNSCPPPNFDTDNFLRFYENQRVDLLSPAQKQKMKEDPDACKIWCIEAAQGLATFYDPLLKTLCVVLASHERRWIAQFYAVSVLLKGPPRAHTARLFVLRTESAEYPFLDTLYTEEKADHWPEHCIQEFDLEKLRPFLKDLHRVNEKAFKKALGWVQQQSAQGIHVNFAFAEIFTPIEEELAKQFYIPEHDGFLWSCLAAEYLSDPDNDNLTFIQPVPAERLQRALYWHVYYTKARGWKRMQWFSRIMEKTPTLLYEYKILKRLHRPAERDVDKEQVIPHVQSLFERWLDELEMRLYETSLPEKFQNVSVECLWMEWAEDFAKLYDWTEQDFEEDYILDPDDAACDTLRYMLESYIRAWISMGLYKKSLHLLEEARIYDINEADLEDYDKRSW